MRSAEKKGFGAVGDCKDWSLARFGGAKEGVLREGDTGARGRAAGKTSASSSVLNPESRVMDRMSFVSQGGDSKPCCCGMLTSENCTFPWIF
jgi:hypothetical protein